MKESEITGYFTKAFEYLEKDPLTGLSAARSAAEQLVKTVFREKMPGQAEGKFDDMLKAVDRAALMPGSIVIDLNYIRISGNRAVHGSFKAEDAKDVSPCIASLKKAANWYFLDYRQSVVPEKLISAGVVKWKPRKATLQDIAEWGLSAEEIVRMLIEIDYETMYGLTEMHVGTDSQWVPIYRMYPDLWTLFVDGPKSISGYLHYLALEKSDFEEACAGKLHDNMITLEKVVFPVMPGEYEIYFSCISLLKKYREMKNFKMLFDSFLGRLEEFAENGIYVKRVCANAFTPEGVSLCRSIGMKHLCDHEDKGKVFLMDMSEMPGLLMMKQHKKLHELYEAYYEKK